MMKHIRSFGFATAALAVSAALLSVPAFAQAPQTYGRGANPPQELSGGPGFRGDDFRNEDRRHEYWRDDDRGDDYRGDRRRAPDFQTAQARCSREGIQVAWNRGYYSAQYDGKPRFVETRRGWEFHGRMRLHDQRGFSHVNTICDLRGRGDVRIEFVK